MGSTKYKAQEKYRQKQVAQRDMVRLSIWVPRDAKDSVLRLAAKLRRMTKTEKRNEQ